MYCPCCGHELGSDRHLCEHCGFRLVVDDAVRDNAGAAEADTAYQNARAAHVSVGIAFILSVISGLGHMYIGKIRMGVGILLAQIAICVIGTYAMVVAVDCDSTAILFISVAMAIIALMLALFSMYDAYVLSKRYNEYVDSSGEKPW